VATDGAAEVRWAHRVPKDAIRRIYESEAAGVLDEALLDDVGTRFAMRCESILAVAEAKRGIVRCPRCDRKGRTACPRSGGRREDGARRWRPTARTSGRVGSSRGRPRGGPRSFPS
jgi:hypothetical protein